MSNDLRHHPRYQDVTAERIRMRELEARFGMLIDNGSVDLAVVREYAAAVQSYTQAVMSWLSWIETETLHSGKTDKTVGV